MPGAVPDRNEPRRDSRDLPETALRAGPASGRYDAWCAGTAREGNRPSDWSRHGANRAQRRSRCSRNIQPGSGLGGASLVVHRHCIDGFFVGSISVSASVGIRTVSISTRADAEQAGSPMRRSGQRACPQVFGAMTGAAHMANSRGRKLYRVTLSAQERQDLKAIVDGTGAAWRRAQILMLAD